MRYGPEHKQETREKILASAARLFRAEGLAGASVERVMRAAGLTVGGFYGHFGSKDALVIDTLRSLMRGYRGAWLAGLEDVRGGTFLEHFVYRYLNRRTRDAETGCAMPSILSELTRSSPEVQAAFGEELAPLLAELEQRLPSEPGVTPRQRALATVALLFGAMALARATRSQATSDEFLEAARAFLAPPR